MERAGAVSVVDFADALDLLFEDGASRSGAAALVDGAGGDVVAAAAGGRRCGRTRPGAFVNLKHERVRAPDHVLAVFGELCRPGRIDSLLKSLDGLIKPLERMLASGLGSIRGRSLNGVGVDTEVLKNVDRVRFARERNDTLRREEVVVGVGVKEPEVVRTRIDLVGSVCAPSSYSCRRRCGQVLRLPFGASAIPPPLPVHLVSCGSRSPTGGGRGRPLRLEMGPRPSGHHVEQTAVGSGPCSGAVEFDPCHE